MSRCEKKPEPLVEYTELSGLDLIYPSNLIIGDSTDEYVKEIDEVVIVSDNNNGLIALVNDGSQSFKNDVIEESNVYVKENKYKMDTLTQIYVGSLTAIGLFVLYRLLTRTK
jgi:hypothetical protein